MTVHKQNAQNGGEYTRSEAWIERTAHPSSDGNQDNWAGFRRVFQELMKTSGRGKVLELAQLISKLPAEAKELIAGVTRPEEAWG